MTTTKTTKITDTTYCGVPARVCDVRVAGAAGLRVQVTYWPTGSGPKNGDRPARTGVLRLVTGNFLKGTGRELAREVHTDITIEQAIEAAQALLTR